MTLRERAEKARDLARAAPATPVPEPPVEPDPKVAIVEFLREKLDEDVDPATFLKGEMEGGARLWRVDVDEFEFVVKDYSPGRGGTPLTPRFLLVVRTPEGTWRSVQGLADLL